MRIRNLLLLLLLLAIFLFAAMNWTAFTAPATLSLLVTTVQAPLGLIMLAISALLVVIFLAFGAWLQTAMLLQTRGHAREMQTQRKLADQTEASRITEMQSFIAQELHKLAEQGNASHTTLMARIEQVEQEMRASVEQSGNTLAAYIGELEDRLEQKPGALINSAGPRNS